MYFLCCFVASRSTDSWLFLSSAMIIPFLKRESRGFIILLKCTKSVQTMFTKVLKIEAGISVKFVSWTSCVAKPMDMQENIFLYTNVINVQSHFHETQSSNTMVAIHALLQLNFVFVVHSELET